MAKIFNVEIFETGLKRNVLMSFSWQERYRSYSYLVRNGGRFTVSQSVPYTIYALQKRKTLNEIVYRKKEL